MGLIGKEKTMYSGYPTAVFQCPHCKRIHRFGNWIEPPQDLRYAINSGVVETISRQCDYCATPSTSTYLQKAYMGG